ncbi:MAG: hypothetical protein ABI925_11875 [Verrucomicrobiota bacterium]
MKIRVVLIVSLAALIALPAIACGPSGGSSQNTGHSMSPGRKQWTKKRMKHLKQQMSDYNSAQKWSDGLGYATGEWVPQMHRNSAEHRRYMINRYEFLALKAEHGRASANDIAEMRGLQAALLSR